MVRAILWECKLYELSNHPSGVARKVIVHAGCALHLHTQSWKTFVRMIFTAPVSRFHCSTGQFFGIANECVSPIVVADRTVSVFPFWGACFSCTGVWLSFYSATHCNDVNQFNSENYGQRCVV